MKFTPFFVHIYAHSSAAMNSRTRGYTLFVRPGYDHTHVIVHAARCNPKDNYNKKIGALRAADQPHCEAFKPLELLSLCNELYRKVWGVDPEPNQYDYLLKRFFH